ncbi:ATP-binding protein [Candidatus Blastococcus massiliensis]|uniref:ATP-binding protein n=1 Tax=Candidatus Blastococcus massiliensis TaxID=1470358 RepID=UPI0004B452F5|nr:ATP-binding protein [Candidatus Blastococcus massiliensis]
MSSLSACVDLPPNAASVRVARHVVTDLMRAWCAPHDVADAALLVTELVANVVDHVGGDASFTLEVTLAGSWLRIAVVDGSSVVPVVQELSRDRTRGRGLQMVQAIADRWGCEERQGGKRVWFDLSPAV